MKIKEKEEKYVNKTKKWFYDHPACKTGFEWAWIFFVSTISALIFAFGFNCFMDVTGHTVVIDGVKTDAPSIVSGGMSGVSQTIVLFFKLCGWVIQDTHLAISILYFLLNIPLLILAFLKIGKRFAIFTAINCLEVSLFINLISVERIPAFGVVFEFVTSYGGGMIGRALFGGLCIGLSSALAFLVDISSGGIDIIATYISLKKGTLVGKYSVILNGVTLTCYTLISIALAKFDTVEVGHNIARAFYTLLYLFTSSLVIDRIHLRNKKVKIEIVTNNSELGDVLVDSFPHGATRIKAEGVYSNKPNYIITMVVSNNEVRPLTNLIKKQEPSAFVQVIPLSQVYGRFHMKPIK